ESGNREIQNPAALLPYEPLAKIRYLLFRRWRFVSDYKQTPAPRAKGTAQPPAQPRIRRYYRTEIALKRKLAGFFFCWESNRSPPTSPFRTDAPFVLRKSGGTSTPTSSVFLINRYVSNRSASKLVRSCVQFSCPTTA